MIAWAVVPRVWALLLLAGVVFGCRPATQPQPTTERATPAPTGRDAPPRAELWYLQSVFGRHVGYEHQSIRPVPTSQGTMWEVTGENRLAVNRSGTTIEIAMRYRSTETPTGELRDFELEMIQGPLITRQRGRRDGDRLQLEVEAAGRRSTVAIHLPPHCGGLLGIQASLWRQPMNPGERRTLHLFLPGLNAVGEAILSSEAWESVTLLDTTARLLRIRVATKIGNSSTLHAILWCDASGLILRQRLESLNVISELTDKDRAVADPTAMLDLVNDIRIPVDVAPDKIASARTAVYRLRFPSEGWEMHVLADSRQKVRVIDAHTLEIEVQSRRLSDIQGKLPDCVDPASDEDRKPNTYIQSDAVEIRRMAEEAVADIPSGNALAEIAAIEAYVHRVMVDRNYRNAFATALDAAKNLEGDCTEHAVLLAALARARGFPARLAMGLLYHERALYYHMWTEIWIEGCWLPLDATLGLGGVGVGHITLARSNLAAPEALVDFLPLMQAIGQLQIEVLDLR